MAHRCSTPLNQTSLGEFLRTFRRCAGERGITGPCEIINVLARAAWDLPLPAPWREESSSTGAVYFWNEVRGAAMWQHPLMEAFLSALESMVEVVRESASISDVVVALAAHLKASDEVAAAKLDGWSSHLQDGVEYFFNEATGQSSWENPATSAQSELHAQYWLAARFLTHFYGDVAEFEEMPAMAGAAVGPLLATLSRLEPPEEVQDYAEWIRASLSSSLPASDLPPRPTVRTRPPLPPLTALPLNGTRGSGPLPHVRCGAARPAEAREVELPVLHRSATASGRLERRKRSHPPLTKYPLRRSLTIWRPVCDEMQLKAPGERLGAIAEAGGSCADLPGRVGGG